MKIFKVLCVPGHHFNDYENIMYVVYYLYWSVNKIENFKFSSFLFCFSLVSCFYSFLLFSGCCSGGLKQISQVRRGIFKLKKSYLLIINLVVRLVSYEKDLVVAVCRSPEVEGRQASVEEMFGGNKLLYCKCICSSMADQDRFDTDPVWAGASLAARGVRDTT